MADRGYRYNYRDHEAQRDEGLWRSILLMPLMRPPRDIRLMREYRPDADEHINGADRDVLCAG